jgi:hypothetical protein
MNRRFTIDSSNNIKVLKILLSSKEVDIAGKEHSSQSMDTTIEKKKKRFYRFQILEIT